MAHDKHENDKYQKNLHILKLITEEVLLCSEQEIAFQSHQEQLNYTKHYYEKWINKGNFIAIINTFAKQNPVLKDYLENGAKKCKNDIMKNPAFLAEFIRETLKNDISEHYAIIADEVTDQFSNKEFLLLCLRYVTYENGLLKIHRLFFDFLQINGCPTEQTVGKKYFIIIRKK